MDYRLIKLFGVALVEDDKRPVQIVNNLAIDKGYIVHPDVCNYSVTDFINREDFNPNATFYKSIGDVLGTPRFSLLIDQLIHYASTYGLDFTAGNGYVPNSEVDIIPYKEFKTILPISREGLFDRCMDMVVAGIPLKQDTLKPIMDFIVDNYKKLGKDIDVDAIKNREAQTIICDKCHLYPKNPDSLFRYIFFKTTGETMVVNNQDNVLKIMMSNHQFNFSVLGEEQMKALASIFLRKKNLFLAFKKTYKRVRYSMKKQPSSNAKYINKLRKMAVTLHQKAKVGFWQDVFNHEYTTEELTANVSKLTNFKKVALIQACLERLSGNEVSLYLVRNQKLFMRTDKGTEKQKDPSYVLRVYEVLKKSLVYSLGINATVTTDEGDLRQRVVRIPSSIRLTLPTSEKSFLGVYPFGTSFDMEASSAYIGIYWKNEWNGRTHTDYDLSYVSNEGEKIGWNSDYTHNAADEARWGESGCYNDKYDVAFSGDMTNADPEASEVIYFRKKCTPGIVLVNGFSVSGDSPRFDLFFGRDKIHSKDFTENYMVDPNTIHLKAEVNPKHIGTEVPQSVVGIIDENGKITLMGVSLGTKHVSNMSREHSSALVKAMTCKSECFVDLKETLDSAGYVIVDEQYDGDDVDVDLTKLEIDTLIGLMK